MLEKENILLVKYFTYYGNLIFLNFFYWVSCAVYAITLGLTGLFMKIVLSCATKALLFEVLEVLGKSSSSCEFKNIMVAMF